MFEGLRGLESDRAALGCGTMQASRRRSGYGARFIVENAGAPTAEMPEKFALLSTDLSVNVHLLSQVRFTDERNELVIYAGSYCPCALAVNSFQVPVSVLPTYLSASHLS